MSNDPTSVDLQQTLLNLLMRVGQLEGTLKTFMEQWSRQDSLAHESRRITFEKIDLLGKQVERVATDVQNVQQDVAELKKEIDEQIMPTVDHVKVRKHYAAGAKSVWAMIGAGVVMLASALAYIGDKIVSVVWPKP